MQSYRLPVCGPDPRLCFSLSLRPNLLILSFAEPTIHSSMQSDANCCNHLMTRSIDEKVKRVTVTLPRHQVEALQTIASREDVSVAWLVRKAIDKLLREGPAIPVADTPQQTKRR